ncbi:hypothetical protein ACFOTA_00650 [Chitinophaga sp. GCM10012297]|uniref:Outer membrane protein beta-barrel domain-containing protein n=1 Tax=Chitinophaga chungangae TaxID=2821488 RepID=A0ABS3Y876_9BACT|nr:hypothetical protein [Chitinophaga chungangae]MBO9150700.1 hypothetical protein [Chitinophaga chungangae]
MKRIYLAVILMICANAASAQSYKTDTARGFDPSRLMVGGSFGMAFGDYALVNISPIVGYRFSPMFAGGVALNAQLSWEKLRDYNSGEIYARYNYTMFGGGLWGRFYPIQQLFLQAQPEYNSIGEKFRDYTADPVTTTKSRYGAPSLLLGGGYAQPIGMGNSAFVIMILYDVLQDDRSPYRNRPVLSAGVNLGF